MYSWISYSLYDHYALKGENSIFLKKKVIKGVTDFVKNSLVITCLMLLSY